MSQASVQPLASAALVGRAEPRLERMFRTHQELIWRGAERAFLFATALRIANQARRRTARFQLEGDMDVRIDPGWQMDRMTNRQTALEHMDHLLTRMDPDLVMVFVLSELEGMSTGEIANLVRIPVGTAASRLRRARLAFRNAAGRLERSRGKSKRWQRGVWYG